MASGRPSGTHPCPGKCGLQVRRALFACRSCWGRLPRELQEPIVDNHLLNPVAHLAAMSVACDWYRANPLTPVVEERCERTELLVGQCACRDHRGGVDPAQEQLRLRARLLDSGDWFAAQYRGRCDTCGTPFEQGAAIRMADRGWRAECCAEET